MCQNSPSRPLDVTIWQISMLILCVYVLLAMAAQALFKLPAEVSSAIDHIDFGICIVFLADFVVQFMKADNKLQYMKWGWIDLISSIPNIQALRWGRMFRIFRILRILRGVRSTRLMFQIMFTNRSHGTFATAALTAFILVIFSTIAILLAETAPKSNIKTAGDALWWSFTTMTTVGYGDFFPVTLEGRIIGAVLMISGIAMFGTFTAYIASWFFEATGNKELEAEAKVLEELKTLKTKLDDIEKRFDERSTGQMK